MIERTSELDGKASNNIYNMQNVIKCDSHLLPTKEELEITENS